MKVKIRNKITEKEAMRVTDDEPRELWEWMGDAYGGHGESQGITIDVKVNTLEGQIRAANGDWIIKGLNGEFYPCKPDIFEKSYEIID